MDCKTFGGHKVPAFNRSMFARFFQPQYVCKVHRLNFQPLSITNCSKFCHKFVAIWSKYNGFNLILNHNSC